jgi:ribonuclease HII
MVDGYRGRVKVRRGEGLLDAWDRERQRLGRLIVFELAAYASGQECVAGVDEVGRGPLAGPVVAAAVILMPDVVRCPDLYLAGLNDSKRLSPKVRTELLPRIEEAALAVGLGLVDASRIDEINIREATFEAMRLAIGALKITPAHLLVDGFPIPGLSSSQEGIFGGDGRSLSIAAASVVAKVTRDRLMNDLDDLYPGYGLALHKGYATRAHRDALRRLGASPVHRRTFVSDSLFERTDGSREE